MGEVSASSPDAVEDDDGAEELYIPCSQDMLVRNPLIHSTTALTRHKQIQKLSAKRSKSSTNRQQPQIKRGMEIAEKLQVALVGDDIKTSVM